MEIRTKLNKNGRIVIPADYRRALGLKPGAELILTLREGEVRILTPASAVKHAQSLVRRYVPRGRSLSKELISERRLEAARE